MLDRLLNRDSAKAVMPNDMRLTHDQIDAIKAPGMLKDTREIEHIRGVLTRQYGVTSNALNTICVVDFGSRSVGVFLDIGQLNSPLHIEIRNRLKADAYKITTERLASVALIAELNKALHEGDRQLDNQVADASELVAELLNLAIDAKTSDAHLCCREESGMLLFRVHRRLVRQRRYEPAMFRKIIAYMYDQMAEEQSRSSATFSLEKRSMQCVINYVLNGVRYKLRWKFIKVHDGWDVIIRILDTSDNKRDFLQLGYEPSQVEILTENIIKSIGLMIWSGKTNSGKSTALKSAMEYMPERGRFLKRYAVEDPTEYKIYGWSQISVQRDEHRDDSENTWSGILKDLLRADPDEIMMGEIRDEVTTDLITDFVYTGHKCYTTLHASSAFGCIPRLNRLGVPNHILSDENFLLALTYQRLMPKVCEHCRIPAGQVLGQEFIDDLSKYYCVDCSDVYCANLDGCEKCQGGISGSVLIAEVVGLDSKLRSYIEEGKYGDAKDYWRSTRRTGYHDNDMQGKTIYEHAVLKMLQGKIDPRDIEATLNSRLLKYELAEATS